MYICIRGYKRLHKERMKWLVSDLIKASLLVFLYVFHMTFFSHYYCINEPHICAQGCGRGNYR